jgi:Bacterial TSP3 repeat
MNRYFLVPALATCAGILINVGTASAAGGMPVVNCVGSQPNPVICMVPQPGAVDSDNDGFSDADEILHGSDPFDANSRPTLEGLLIGLGNVAVPGHLLEPTFDLITVTPNGDAITTDLVGALAALGHAVPDHLAGIGIKMAPAGVDLGSIGGNLNWDIHNNGGSSNPAPPHAPNSGLYGYYSDPVTKLGNPVVRDEGGGVTSSTRVGNATDPFGTRTMETDVEFSEGGKKIGREFTVTQGKENSYTAETTILDANGNVLGTGTGTGETTAEAERKATEAAEADAKATKEAKEKAAAEAKAKAEAEEKADAGQHTDPGADQPVDPSSLTPEQFARAVAVNDGSTHTNTGDTGFELAENGYVDPIITIIYVNPDADTEGDFSGTPDQGESTNTNYDPNLPTPGGDFTGGPSRSGGGR